MESDESLEEIAVQLRRVNKFYGLFKNKVAVLKEVDLDVPKGCVFGLLGPSGCGKTTLLSCVVGRIRADKGTIRVFDRRPGSARSKIPGTGVGYMPQEIALFDDLTAKETLEYFGRIYNLSEVKIAERVHFLFDLLNLPTEWKLIKNLSGGQQRRVSFAVALIHEPPLLILDEPTVGMDPVLRINVWNHLFKLSSGGNITTIITTHYVEEAKKANKVALMKDGRILTSEDPRLLLNRYNLPSLEDVFLHLCQTDSLDEEKSDGVYYSAENNHKEKTGEIARQHSPEDKTVKRRFYSKPNFNKMTAIGIKNVITLLRNWPLLLFQFFSPSVQTILFCLAFGGHPRDLNIAVVNEDKLLGEQFLSYIDSSTVHQVAVSDVQIAENMALRGETWGLIHIWENFTTSLTNGSMTNDDILARYVHVRLDTSNLLISYSLQRALVKAVFQLSNATDATRGFDFKTNIPLEFEEPMFGTDENNLLEYVIPGIIVMFIFFFGFGLTAFEFSFQKTRGILDRSYVAGVTAVDAMCGHIVIQIFVMTFQVCSVLFCLVIIFQFPCRGNVAWVVLVTLSQGLCGISCGYFVSSIFQDVSAIATIGLGGVFTTMILSGVLWPLEAMPNLMADLARIVPQTHACEALRCVFTRGWNISYPAVWRGFLFSAIWTIGFLALSLLVVKIKR